MATRSAARKRRSLQEVPMPDCLPAEASTARKRHTRRQKENVDDELTHAGNFVRFPRHSEDESQIGEQYVRSDVGAKTTRTQRKKKVLKEQNAEPSTMIEIADNDGTDVLKFTVGRATRSRKNVFVENTGEIDPVAANEGTYYSGKAQKKSRKRKAADSQSEHESDCHVINKPKDTDGLFNDSQSDIDKKKKPKRKLKKNKNVKDTPDVPEITVHLVPETAASVDNLQSPSGPQTTCNSINTSVESFHSAAGSPEPCKNTLVPEYLNKSDQTTKNLNSTFDKNDKTLNTTYEKNDDILDTTYEKKSPDSAITLENSYEKPTKKSTPKKKIAKESTSLNEISGKTSSTPIGGKSLRKSMSIDNLTIRSSDHSDTVINTTYDKSPGRRSSRISNQNEKGKISEDLFNTFIELVDSSLDSTLKSFERTEQSVEKFQQFKNDSHETYNGNNATGSNRLKSNSDFKQSDYSNKSLNHTDPTDETIPESSNSSKYSLKVDTPPKPLIREGTFTKESPIIVKELVSPTEAIPSLKGSTDSIKTPSKTKTSVSAPDSTPYHSSGKKTLSNEKSLSTLNLTRSIDKDKIVLRRSSSVLASRQTRVMFCSPVFTPAQPTDKKRIIKSSLKGSNKSFVFEEISPPRPAARKRSYTHNDADDVRAKRKKLAGDELNTSVSRLSRPKGSSSAAKPTTETTPSKCKALTPQKSRSESKPTSVRSKLPDFAALHKKQFDKMESLGECKERRAKRARQMLFPTSGAFTMEGRKSPKVAESKIQEKKAPFVYETRTTSENAATKATEPAKMNKSYTRFGFKLQTDYNPFSVPSIKNTQNKPIKDKMNATISHLPTFNKCTSKKAPTKLNGVVTSTEISKLNGTIPSLRRERSKHLLTREKSSTTIVANRKKENRDIIKGVRTNRRFELQMKSRQCV